MLEYFAYKKFKKNKAEKKEKGKESAAPLAAAGASTPAPAASPKRASTSKSHSHSSHLHNPLTPPATPLLDDDDERFLERLTSGGHPHDDTDDAGSRPPLPPRVKTPDLTWDSDSESFRKMPVGDTTTTKEEDPKKANRLTLLLRKATTKKSGLNPNKSQQQQLTVPTPEATREKDDLSRVLDELSLSAHNNKAFSLSTESTELVHKFTLVLKDLVNGVPTAVNDLTSLLDDPDGKLAKNYEKLPSSLKKLVTQLPEKLSSTLAPELLAVAAEAQGLGAADAAASGGLKGAAKRLLTPKNLKEIVTKPGAVVSMLKAIMNALKVRWPAFIGTNVIWSLALFLLLYVLWYCHKRGREVRLEKESVENVVDGAGRVEELPDDLALPAPASSEGLGSGAAKTPTPVVIEPAAGEGASRR
ncbi:hypothetical protein B0T17DRAFT_520245 [Bombardia bombarda]|uniref:Ring-like domain-containing protein n=1 Tax=Bombardia bombarda TaxID=252184 RepID=A0AA39XMS3_9PEZI|nr:hypothetical protein B0T17DRAFT_520245 [Bombardia bombarda]